MKVYKSKGGYYYKIYNSGRKIRISYLEYQKKKRMRGGGNLNYSNNLKQKIDEYKWNNLEYLFDTYDTPSLKNTKYGNIICIRDWKIKDDNLKGKGIGSYQLMYLLFNSDSDKIFVNFSQNDNFWKKFLNFGGKYYGDWDDNLRGRKYIRDSGCGSMVEYEYPTLKFLKEQQDEINENKLYESAYNIINKYETYKNVINSYVKNTDNNENNLYYNDEETKCSKFKHSGKCRRKGCWWYYDTKKCVPHYGKLKNRN